MKSKWLLIGLGLFATAAIGGCSCAGPRGGGVTFGIVVTVEDSKPAAGRDSLQVWIKSDETDSQPDCYVIKDDDQRTKSDLENAARDKAFVKVTFTRYGPWSVMSKCSGDLIYRVERIQR